MRKKQHWSGSRNGIQGYRDAKKSHSEALKKDRERLKLIRDFEKNEIVTVTHYGREYIGTVMRVNDKTYGVAFDDNYVSFDKETLHGYTDYIKKQITGDGRRFIGELCELLKRIMHDK